MRFSFVTRFVLLASLLTLLPGCFGQTPGKVSGRVLVDGQPTGGYELMFIKLNDGASYSGFSDIEGKYELFGGRARREIQTGEYKVVLTALGTLEGIPKPMFKLPSTATQAAESTLIYTIKPGVNEIDIEVASEK